MANPQHLNILRQGVDAWNQWRENNLDVLPDLRNARFVEMNFRGYNLCKADFSSEAEPEDIMVLTPQDGVTFVKAHREGTDLRGTKFYGTNLCEANFRDADLRGAELSRANLNKANFSRADLRDADLRGADLREADLTQATLFGADLSSSISFTYENGRGTETRNPTNLSGADLEGADLRNTNLVEANFENANLSDCSVYGISAWEVNLKNAIQKDLVITPHKESTITVDNLKVAQFIYLLIKNEEIRDVIDTITSKVVLILGRFSRMEVLDTLRDGLRKYNYLPILFDFEKPASQTIAETISTLAHLARFIVVDITDPRSVPAELATIVPSCVVPIQPLLEAPSVVIEEEVTQKHMVEENSGKGQYALFSSLMVYPWILPIFHYQDAFELLNLFKEHIVDPAEQKAQELARKK